MSLADIIDRQDTDLRLVVKERKKKMTAYLEGSKAYHDEKKFKDNPKPTSTMEYYQWAKGHFEAQEKERGR